MYGVGITSGIDCENNTFTHTHKYGRTYYCINYKLTDAHINQIYCTCTMTKLWTNNCCIVHNTLWNIYSKKKCIFSLQYNQTLSQQNRSYKKHYIYKSSYTSPRLRETQANANGQKTLTHCNIKLWQNKFRTNMVNLGHGRVAATHKK